MHSFQLRQSCTACLPRGGGGADSEAPNVKCFYVLKLQRKLQYQAKGT